MKKVILALGLLIFYNTSVSQELNLDSIVKNFKGYKVPNNVKSLGSSYWKRNSPVMVDLVVQTFQKPLSFANIANQKDCVQAGWGGAISGDFNNDGYIDVFTPGFIDSSMYKDNNRGTGFSFLIWDTASKVFKDTSLLNDKNKKVLISAFKAVPAYLNSDNYVDIVIFPADDSQAPIMLIVSDGMGGYDYSEITTNEKDFAPGTAPTIFKSSGDVNDLNGDGLPDIYLPANNFSYILWGISTFPYFDPTNHPKFVEDITNFPGFNNNGFGEICTSCAGVFSGVIGDVNKDGGNDLILFGASPTADRIVINKGSGRFNETGVVNIPRYIAQGDGGDYMMMDINDDGLNDFVTLTGGGLDGKSSYNNIYTVIQQTNGSFIYDTTIIEYSNSFKTKFLGGAGGTGAYLFSYDFNNDGKNDIGYINSGWGDDCGIYNSITNTGNIMPFKTVFIKEGNKYIEKDYYQFDPYAKYLLKLLRKRYLCSPELLKKPNFSNSDFLFCKNDSLKISVNNLSTGSSLMWNYDNKSVKSSDNFKYFTDTTSLFVAMVNNEFGCSRISDKISLSFKSSPPTPIVKDTTYCFNSKTIALSAQTLQMHDVYWSEQAGMLGAKFYPTPNSTIAGIQKFYVSQIDPTSNCVSSQAVLTVKIEKAVNIPIVKDTSYCNNFYVDTLKVIPSVGNTIKWYGSNAVGGIATFTPIKPSTENIGTKSYYVSQINTSSGCESERAKIDITTYPIPNAPLLMRDSENNLVANTNGITWYKDGALLTDTTQKIKPSTSGSYSVKTTQNGCMSALSVPYYYLVTDIINLSKDEYIKLAPNPFVNQLNFDFVIKDYQKLNMDVYDIASGEKVATKQNLIPGMPIYLGQLAAGTYIIKLNSIDNKITYHFKMIKL